MRQYEQLAAEFGLSLLWSLNVLIPIGIVNVMPDIQFQKILFESVYTQSKGTWDL